MLHLYPIIFSPGNCVLKKYTFKYRLISVVKYKDVGKMSEFLLIAQMSLRTAARNTHIYKLLPPEKDNKLSFNLERKTYFSCSQMTEQNYY